MASRLCVMLTLKEKITVTQAPVIEAMKEHFDIVWQEDFEKEPKKYPNIVGILELSMTPIRKEWLDNMPNLKIVALGGVGYSHLDIPLIRSYGVKISNAPNVVNDDVANFGITLLLAAARDMVNLVSLNKSPTFHALPFYMPSTASEVTGSNLGVVGMGRIGYTVAKRAMAFDMKILYHNRKRRPAEEEAVVGATYFSSLNEMLPLCDFVIVVVCLTEDTRHMIGEEQFKLMKKSAIFINISRGDTVDQEALAKALKTGEIRSAALDVTTPEPLPRDHELLKMNNVIITPHIGCNTNYTRLKVVRLACENVFAAVNGTKLPTEVLD